MRRFQAMRFQGGRCAALLAPLFLVAACASEPSAPQMQSIRMQARLTPEIQSGKLAVQPLPNGTQIVIPEQALFAPGSATLDTSGQDVLTYVVQALLEPTIITIQVADASDSLQGARAQAVADYFRYHRLSQQVLPPTIGSQPVAVGAPGTAVQGMTITVNVMPG